MAFIVRCRIPNFRYYGNKDQYGAHFNDTIKLPPLRTHSLVQDSGLYIHTFSLWSLKRLSPCLLRLVTAHCY